MKLCPRSARALNQPVEDYRAKEWCISMFNAQTCEGCTEGCRQNRRLLSELVPGQSKTKENNEESGGNAQQLKLF